MEVVAFDKFVSAERFRELGVEGVDAPGELYERADIITLHLPKTPETVNWIDAEAIAADAGRGADRQLRPRRADRPRRAAGGARVGQGRRRRARRLPRGAVHRAPGLRRRRRRRHPPSRRLHRRGPGPGGAWSPRSRSPPRCTAAWSPTRSTSPRCARRRWRRWRRSSRSARSSAASPRGWATARSDRVRAEFRGRLAEHDTRLLGIAALVGILSGHTEEPVNLVNAPQMAEERGIELIETKDALSEDFTELVTVEDRVRRRRRRGRRHRRRAAQRALPRLAPGARASTFRSPITSRSSATRTSRG